MMKRIIGNDKERFMSKVDKTDTCWNWKAYIAPGGYGKFGITTAPKIKKIMYAHRFSYELLNGKIPEGKVIDHLCRNRSCVNPEHLEVVDMYTNNIRGDIHLKKKSKLPVGVYHHGKKFRTYFSINGITRFIGVYETVESASRAYNLAKERC
jgi:hypothetical protein